jgi:hypothetical protein
VVYPEASGFAAWTNAAFGPFVSFQCSMLHWTAGVLDNAVYPGLLLSYITENRCKVAFDLQQGRRFSRELGVKNGRGI